MSTNRHQRRTATKSARKSGADAIPIPHIKDDHIVLLGDCLEVMTELRDDGGFYEKVDLVYLDPPFNSKAEYAFVFGMKNAAKRSVVAFSDTWKWTEETEFAYERHAAEGRSGRFLEAMRASLGTTGPGGAMLSYLTMMLPRLEVIRDLLKPDGSVYLHCDGTAGHYLKAGMDAIFGIPNFRNDIAWCYPPGGKGPKFGYHRKHDNILFYGKSANAGVFHRPHTELTESARQKFTKRDESGRVYKEYPGGRTYLDEAIGRPVPSWWTDINSLGQTISSERLGYPTQKPVALLQRIVAASSNPGDIVMDPFCGCGTTLAACRELGRKFIGVDMEPFAAKTIKARMAAEPYKLDVRIGYAQPQSADDFADLARRGKYLDFQYHAITAIPGAIPNPTQSGDRGVDGWIFARREGEKKDDTVVISVKAGEQTSPAMVRELRGVVADMRPLALAGVLITLGEPTRGMQEAAEAAGYYTDGKRRRPKIQILPIRRLLAEKWNLPRIVEAKGVEEFRHLFPTL